MPNAAPPEDLEECERRVEKVVDLAKNTGENLIKKGAELAETWARSRPRMQGAFSPPPDPGRWSKVFGPAEPKGRLDFSKGVVADWGLELLKPEEGGVETALWWIVKIGKAGWAIRKATPLGIAIEAAFLLNDVADDASKWYAQRTYDRYIAEKRIDVPLAEVGSAVGKLYRESEAAMEQTKLEEIRSGGYYGQLFRDSLVEFTRLPKENQKLALAALGPLGRYCFGKRMDLIRGCLLRVACDAFATRAWGLWLLDRARHPEDHGALGFATYAGPVDIRGRQRHFGAFGRHFVNLSNQLGQRTRGLAIELNYATDWHKWYGG